VLHPKQKLESNIVVFPASSRQGRTEARPPHSFPQTGNVIAFPDDRILATGTTNGGKVRRRMRSRFQKGCLQKSGDWIVVRFRIDTPEGRELKAEKVCPASGLGLLTKAEQKRRAAEIIEAAGVNKTEQNRHNLSHLPSRRKGSWSNPEPGAASQLARLPTMDGATA